MNISEISEVPLRDVPVRKPIEISGPATGHKKPGFLRPNQAGRYLVERYGFGAPRTLAKYRVFGGGPEYHKAGRIVLYTTDALDTWALARIGGVRRSTSDAEGE